MKIIKIAVSILCIVFLFLQEGWTEEIKNLITNSSFEDVQDGKILGWRGSNLTQTSDAHSGKNAAKLTLSPEQKSVVLSSQPFKVEPGAEYYVEFWIKKDGGCRVIPMLVFWPGDYTKRKEIGMKDFPYRDEIKEYTNYLEIIKAPKDKNFVYGKFRIYVDWYGVTKSGTKSLFIDDVIVYKISKKQ